MKDIIFTLEKGSEWIPEIYYPVPAIKEIPAWYKNMQSSEAGDNAKRRETETMKRCMPVFDSIASGYIIKTFTELTIRQVGEGLFDVNWSYDTFPETVSFHSAMQVEGYKNLNLKNGAPKLRNPWGIKTPPGYSVLIISPMHRPASGIRIMEGIVDTDRYVNSVQFPFILDDGFEGDIPAGTPIAQVIPFKRDEFKMSIGGDKEREEQIKSFASVRTNWINGYRNLMRSKKNYL